MAEKRAITMYHRLRDWLPLCLVLLVALSVRLGVLLALPNGLSKDTDGYRLIAGTWLRSGRYEMPLNDWQFEFASKADFTPEVRPMEKSPLWSKAFRPPLYPLLLSYIADGHAITPQRIGLLHLVLGVASTWLTYHLAGWWGLRQGKVVGALFVACDPILLFQSTQIMTETLATFIAICCLYTLTRASTSFHPLRFALAGGALGLAVLCRPVFLVWLVLTALTAPTLGGSWARRCAIATAFLVAACLTLAPWTMRNQIELGRPIVTTTHGGYTLLLGNNAYFYDHIRSGKWLRAWDADELQNDIRKQLLELEEDGARRPPALLEAPELFHDRFYYDQAFDCIRRNPGTFCAACALRVWRLWGILPSQTDAAESLSRRLLRYAVVVWYAGVFVLTGLGAFALKRRLWQMPWLWGVLLCLSFTAVHTFYWTDLRMRAPLMPFVALVAGVGFEWLRARRKQQEPAAAAPVGGS